MSKIFFLLFLFNNLYEEIKEYYKELQTVKGDFYEEIYIDGEKEEEFEGTVYVKRPFFLKMVIYKPDSQILLVDTGNVFLYYKEWKQVQIKRKPPYLADFFLLNLKKYCNIVKEEKKGNEILIKWSPRDSSLIPYSFIETYLQEDYNLKKLVLILEQGKNFFIFNFKNFIKNPFFKEEEFKINFPKNATIIEE